MSEYQNRFWDSLQQMTDELGDGHLGPKATFDTNSKEAEIVASFLKQWSVYLHAIPSFVVWMLNIPGWVTKQIYGLSTSVELLFSKVFALFGLFDNLGNQSTVVGQVYHGLQLVGSAVFVAFLIARVLMSLFSTPFKYKEAFNHIILVTAAVAFLPTAMTSFGSVIANSSLSLIGQEKKAQQEEQLSHIRASGAVATESTPTETKKNDSLSVQPLQDNITDLWQLAKNKFDVNKLGRFDGDNGYINRSQLGEGVKLNKISDDNVHSIDFSDNYGANNKELIDYFDKQAKDNNFYTGLPTIFHTVLKSYEYDSDGEPSLVEVTGYKYHSILKAGNVLIPVYPRYRVEWITLWVEQIMLLLLLIGLLFSTIRSIFNVLLSAMVAPIVGYTSVEDSSKFLDLLRQIFSGIAGIFFEVIIVKYAMWFLSSAPTATTDAVGSFTSGLSSFETAIAHIALYVATYVAATMGSRAIENWLGVSTGAKSGMMTAAGTVFAAYKGAQMAGGLATGTVNAVAGRKMPGGQRTGGLVRGINNMDRGLKNFGGKASGAVKRGAQGAVNGASKAAGSMAGFMKAGNENGYGNAAKSAMRNAASNISQSMPNGNFGSSMKAGFNNIKNSAGNVKNAASESYQQGRDTAYAASSPSSSGDISSNTVQNNGDSSNVSYSPKVDMSNPVSPARAADNPTSVQQVGGGNTDLPPRNNVNSRGGNSQQLHQVQTPQQPQQQRSTANSVKQPTQTPKPSTPKQQRTQAPTASQTPKSTPQPQQPQVKEDKLNRIGSKQNETEL
ncbi:pLS20_p028 family conjugation system transmembrane protein [Streptococcus hyointestinalis]|nr:hypothetical protein [Streptococcus hyointestinalis]